MSHCNRAVAMENQHALRKSVRIWTRVPLDAVAQLDLALGFSSKWLEDGIPEFVLVH